MQNVKLWNNVRIRLAKQTSFKSYDKWVGLSLVDTLRERCGVVQWVAHSLSDSKVVGSNASTAYFYVIMHQSSASSLV